MEKKIIISKISQWWNHEFIWHNTNIFENFTSWALLILATKPHLEKMLDGGGIPNDPHPTGAILLQ